MSQIIKVYLKAPVFIEGPHGAYASVAVNEVVEINRQQMAVIEITSHRGSAKEGQAPGPLSARTCDVMIDAITDAMQYLDKLRVVPAANEVFAKLVNAERLANREIEAIQVAKKMTKQAEEVQGPQ